jgi:hypothetical protein
MTKKKVLIGLVGLYRTFKLTSVELFNKLILPNADNYDFDIIINTDYECNILTSNRPANKYTKIEYLYDDLYKYYNIHNQLKDIIIYNKPTEYIIFPWFLFYKRIQQIIEKHNDMYDVYIIMRLDVIIDNILNLDTIQNELCFITGYNKRNAYLHNRDMDLVICGNYKPFMYWIYLIINTFNTILNKKRESFNFYNKFNDIIIKEINIIKNNSVTNLNSIQTKIKLLHTTDEIIDNYTLNNVSQQFNLNKYYNLSNSYIFNNVLYNKSIILQKYNVVLSENKCIIIHSHIIR